MAELVINKSEFLLMPIKQQNLILFENTEELKKMIKVYKFNQKIQYALIAFLFIGMGFGKYIGVV